MSRPQSRLERLGARLRPWVLLGFMAWVFLAASGGRLPVEPLEQSAEDRSGAAHAPGEPRGTGCPAS